MSKWEVSHLGVPLWEISTELRWQQHWMSRHVCVKWVRERSSQSTGGQSGALGGSLQHSLQRPPVGSERTFNFKRIRKVTRNLNNLGLHEEGCFVGALKSHFYLFSSILCQLRTKDNLWESVISFKHVGPKDQSQVITLNVWFSYPVSHLANTVWSFLWEAQAGLKLHSLG